MFNDVFEQFQSAGKPFAELLTLTTESTGQMLRKQGEFVSGVFADSVEFSKDVLSQKDPNAIVERQKQYFETMQEKVVANGQQVYSDLTEVQEKTIELVNNAVNKAGEAVTEATNLADES